MSNLKPFPIFDLQIGLNNYLAPWRRPIDAFEPLTNAYVYRGKVRKRAGYTQFGNTLSDGKPVMGIMRAIDEGSGVIKLLVASTQHLYLYNAGGNTFGSPLGAPVVFTGNITNFFNSTNWQPVAGGSSFLYMTNNVDPITVYNVTSGAVTQPTLTINGAGATISNCLDVVVYKQRMLYIRPTISTSAVPENQTILWSSIGNPTLVLTDVAGNGGSLAAPTGDIIQSVEFLRDVLVVFFTNSTWIFRYTGDSTNPFRWDKINNSKNTNAPYGSIAYDQRCTSVGSSGLIACDGVNVQRYDLPIIEYYESQVSEQYYGQVYSQRYENLQQGWMLYVSNDANRTLFPLVGGVAPGSDSALIYNFLENTWATYTFSRPMTCLGTFYKKSGTTWAQLTQKWEDTDMTWNSYSSQKAAPILLAGDTTGNVWYMDDESAVTDNGVSIVPDIVSTKWNPVITAGQKVQFLYIDVYYKVVSKDPDPDNAIQVVLNFYIDDSPSVIVSRKLTLDGTGKNTYAWKRIYVNVIGEFVQMEIDPPSVDSYMEFLGFILWCEPAGRFTP